MDKKISIIITACEKDRYLIPFCIESINKSTYQNYEIIIVDEGKERSTQRNIGAKKAAGDFLLFLDVDMTIHPFLLNNCKMLCYIQQIDGLFIPEIFVGNSYWDKVRNFERSFYNGTRIDAIRFIRKEYWIPFDEALTGVEDWDWDRRFQGKKGITQYPLYHNEGKFDFKRYINKKSYYSGWMDLYSQKYPKAPELSFVYRFFGVFIERGKWIKIINHPILFCSVLALKLICAIIYLKRKKS